MKSKTDTSERPRQTARHGSQPGDFSLSRAVLGRALKTGLRFPVPGALEWLQSSEAKRALVQAARVLDGLHEGQGGHEGSLAHAVQGFCSLPDSTLVELEQRYNRLFGHSLRGRVCPYETEYGGSHLFQQAHQLSDISGFYLAFGLRPATENNERVDHITYELQFFEFLSVKEAVALETGDQEMFEVTRGTLKRFLTDHLGRFGRAFGLGLAREDGEGFYGKLGVLCEALLRSESERLGVPVGPDFLELCSTEEENLPMACGEDTEAVLADGASFEV
ncbi:MAG: molecular chaperone [Acidobacteriota bacterium]